MRALLDANIYISYLLSKRPEASAVGALLELATAGKFDLLFTPGIADEIRSTVGDRPDLAAKITPDDVESLLTSLDVLAEWIARITEPVPSVGRDPKDDYLIAHALLAEANYLVSWDKDLRDLGEVGGIKLVSPPEFLQVLRDGGLA